MTAAESNNQRATVEEFEERLDDCIAEALGAGIPIETIRGSLDLALMGLKATADASEAEKAQLVGPKEAG